MKDKKFHISLLLLFLSWIPVLGQDDLLFDQNVMRQEFINPAYNSFKDYTSVNILSRHQWINQLNGGPETYAANVYIPVAYSGFGIGIMAVNQTSGIRKRLSFSGCLSHNIRISAYDYLAFGYSIGVQNISHNQEKIKTYSDVDFGGLDISSTKLLGTLGLFFYDPNYFIGLSSGFLVNNDKDTGIGLIPGIDFTSGYMYGASSGLVIRPEVVVKYYPVKMYVYENESKKMKSGYPVVDVGVNFLLADKLWLGTSHRFGLAQTFSVSVNAWESFKFGYTFELGLGEGLNQLNSHGVHLSWNMAAKKALNGFGRSERYNVKGLMGTHLYR